MTQASLLERIQYISSEMTSHNDHIHAQKAIELNSKLTDGRLTIALCGHFSAGKSTLVNTLCGAKLLPSSPIPTSANVVTISYGEESKAEVEVYSNGATRYDEVSIDKLDQYCTDGETFVSVHIQYPSALLKKGIVLLDTPGIDSTDAAHKLATESALHMADVVFYVMDYNHVQSEINFSFAKELKEWGKPLYFIVNQIDKHREQELSFEHYQQSVADAFHAWHLEPAGILYLSLREPQHQYHQWELLQSLLDQLAGQQVELSDYSVWSSIYQLTKEHGEQFEEQHEQELFNLLQAIGGEESLLKLEEELNQHRALIDQKLNAIEQYPIVLRKEIDTLLHNANITPANLRDLAHQFLESQKPGFRQGLLFSKGKTVLEQDRRLAVFYEELMKLSGAAIEWHLKQLMREASKRASYVDAELEQLLSAIDHSAPTPQSLVDKVNSGAVFGNEYTMTYSKNLSESIKQNYRQAALQIVDELWKHMKDKNEKELATMREALKQLEQQAESAAAYRKLQREIESYKQQLLHTLEPRLTSPALPNPETLAVSDGNSTNSDAYVSFVEKKESVNLSELLQADNHTTSKDNIVELKHASEREISEQLLQAAEQLRTVEGLETNANELQQKSERLLQHKFTISLFGAFSAGKSSLANALIGDAVLPVSPNPTTAAINSLLPPQDGFEHNTAAITLKSEQLMIDDIYYSLSLLGTQLPAKEKIDVKQLFKLIDRITPESIHSGGRAHYSFIKAARVGWDQQEAWLGKQRKVNVEQYIEYVANENLSCFVEEIKYYYDCPLTAAGIVLVDTPGADSVNARHTGVAFNYIKNTDAILFVTYYNHAFSHADRQFLDQLGRVKDQFELDKMFFIVNAADLAADANELQHVLKHVESNLNQHGIVNPRMFPISSIQALEGKANQNELLVQQSGIAAFEQQFFNFIHGELGTLAVSAAKQDLLRSSALVEGLLQAALSAQSDKEATLAKISSSEVLLHSEADKMMMTSAPQALMQEIEELMYYIIQRISFRFNDFYQYAFNPSQLRDDIGGLSQIVWTAWLELQRTLALELEQELLATTLRVEKKLANLQQEIYEALEVSAKEQLAGYQQQPYSLEKLLQPIIPHSWEYDEMKAKWLWQQFKSPKTFFEGNGKAELRKELEAMLFPSMEKWMKVVQLQWQEHYGKEWSNGTLQLAEQTKLRISQYRIQQTKLLSDESYVQRLKQVAERIAAIIGK